MKKAILVAQDTIPALGHMFTVYVYNNDATTEADGTEQARCEHEGCDEIDIRTAKGTKLEPTNTQDYVAGVSIYTHDRIIVIEHADADIDVYDVTGRVISHKDATQYTTVQIKVPVIGVYVVKCGNVSKRVIVQ